MYIRFVIAEKDPDSGQRQGVFQALSEFREAGELFDYEEARLDELFVWFNKNLREPSRLRRSPHKYHSVAKAISWFKDSATIHLTHMRELVAILEDHDTAVQMLQTEKPGYIVYEDEYQIVAEAFKDTGA